MCHFSAERERYIRAREAGVWGLGMAEHVLIIGWITRRLSHLERGLVGGGELKCPELRTFLQISPDV